MGSDRDGEARLIRNLDPQVGFYGVKTVIGSLTSDFGIGFAMVEANTSAMSENDTLVKTTLLDRSLRP